MRSWNLLGSDADGRHNDPTQMPKYARLHTSVPYITSIKSV